jgi:hypothetical protein
MSFDIPVLRLTQRVSVMMAPVITDVAMPDFRGDAASAIAECRKHPGTDAKLVGWTNTLHGFERLDDLDD